MCRVNSFRMDAMSTERLILRDWKRSDRKPFARINADPRVMEFFPQTLSREESDVVVDRIEEHFRRHGFGLYAAELKDEGRFIGFTGIAIPRFEARFTPCVEIGWRLAAEYWGKGLATEAARAVLEHGFESLAFDKVVSFTVPANTRSLRVMEKLGMTRGTADDFDHPNLPKGHPLRRHVLYRIDKGRFYSLASLVNTSSARPASSDLTTSRIPSDIKSDGR